MAQAATIFALSSGHGRAGVSVIRVSGPAARAVLEQTAPPCPQPRFAALRRIKSAATGELLDTGLVLWFPAPKSETGEDMAELHVHGGRAVVYAVLAAIGQIAGCRLAEPGEFARRAFENGKIDLTAAEGLADLIDAETAVQRRQALRQAEGALGARYQAWRQRLLAAMALMEAAIDFSDEPDVARDATGKARGEVQILCAEIGAHLDDGHRGELIRSGFQVVLTGAPNVGKSSLLNALARRDVAIVSEEAGTTRDVIEVKLDLQGLAILISDTAGIRTAQGKVEEEGIRRTFGRAHAADLVLWLMDATQPFAAPPLELAAEGERLLRVANKVDLLGSRVPPFLQRVPPFLQYVMAEDVMAEDVMGEDVIAVSATTGFGLERLERRISAIASDRIGEAETPALTQVRHRQELECCKAALSAFLSAAIDEIELRAEDLRQAALALGRLTGAVDVEDVLDQVFGRFCIGK